MKSKQEKLDYLSSLKKETDIHEILAEILPKLGFNDIKITHEKGNKPEFGKDLVCSKLDEIENKKDWIAFVVKKGKVSGKSGAVQEIDDQAKECFKYPYNSLEQTKKIPINKVKIVTNETFSAGARDKIFYGNNDDKANIDFWDAEKLIYFIDNYYSKFWIQGSANYKEYVERIQNRIQNDNLIKSLRIDNKKVEKLLASKIEPKLSERITKDDGSIDYLDRKANTVISLPNNSILIGEPGCGKTTLFKTLSNEIIIQNSLRNNQEFYPIILTFKEIELSGFDIINSIKLYFQKEWNSDLNIDSEKIINTESCVLFVDALDELPQIESKKSALAAISKFNLSYPNIKVVCSSRPSDYLFNNCETIGFRYLEIDDLNRAQIESFLNNYFGEDMIKSKSLLKSLKDSEILEKLPKTPLTIALITMLFDEREMEIPATISDLYESFVNLLIGKTEIKQTVDLIEIGIKRRIISHIAKYMHVNLINALPYQDAKKLILNYSIERGQNINIEKVLNEILGRVGLLIINDKNEIEFKHQSFQEYFTAYEIFHHRREDKEIFVNNFNDLWWQNVAIFFAGMSKDSPELIQGILDNSKPKSISELISNTGGIGKLLQASYNTPKSERILGIQRGILNTNTIISKIINEESKDTEFWKPFSKYGLMQVFGAWFQQSNWSITLIEPLAENFDQKIGLLSNEILDQNKKFELEFELFLSSAILASDDFMDFERLYKFVDKSNLFDLNILATINTHMKFLDENISKHEKKNELIKKIQRKVRKRIVFTGDDYAKLVNIPIKDYPKKIN